MPQRSYTAQLWQLAAEADREQWHKQGRQRKAREARVRGLGVRWTRMTNRHDDCEAAADREFAVSCPDCENQSEWVISVCVSGYVRYWMRKLVIYHEIFNAVPGQVFGSAVVARARV